MPLSVKLWYTVVESAKTGDMGESCDSGASCPAVVLGLRCSSTRRVQFLVRLRVSGTCSSENSINDDTLDARIRDGTQRVLATVRHFPGGCFWQSRASS
jgi:hypothetical protein